MRLISIHDAELSSGAEEYRTDSVEHSVYLHTRMWPYLDFIQPRSSARVVVDSDWLNLHLGLLGPESFVHQETMKLGEATKLVLFPCRDKMEVVAMTSDDEIVQVIGTIPAMPEGEEPTRARVFLTGDDELEEHWRDMDEEGGPTGKLEALGTASLTLPLEYSDRYADFEFQPIRALTSGDGNLYDMRTACSAAVSIIQAVDSPSEIVDIADAVFPHPARESWLDGPNAALMKAAIQAQMPVLQQAGLADDADEPSVPRSKRKRRRTDTVWNPRNRSRKKMC